MARILLIETATKFCGAALSVDGEVISKKEHTGEQYVHSEKLALFVDEVLKDSHGLDAVAVSRGPGSYTGLRIGVSLAKGISYAHGIPLISVSTLKSMAWSAINGNAESEGIYIPMMDARRMEVFMSAFDESLEEVLPVQAAQLEEFNVDGIPGSARIYYFGDGADKAREHFSKDRRTEFMPRITANLEGMAVIAESRFISGKFEDVAYFEPYYLKDFVAIPSKKNRLK